MPLKSKGFTLTTSYQQVLPADHNRAYCEFINQSGSDALLVLGSTAAPANDTDAIAIKTGTSWFSSVPIGAQCWAKGSGSLVIVSNFD